MTTTPRPPWQDALPCVTIPGPAPASHLLFVVAESMAQRIDEWPHAKELAAVLQRRRRSVTGLCGSTAIADLPDGSVASWVVAFAGSRPFSRLSALRKAVLPILAERPELVRVHVVGTQAECAALQDAVLRVLLINGLDTGLRRIEFGPQLDALAATREIVLAEGNAFARWLTSLPANVLTPTVLREVCEEQSRRHGWHCRVYRLAELEAMGAGCFAAVAGGSDDAEQCIVHLRSASSSSPSPSVALVGKGVCFDTGGYNVKSAADMQLMHEDMGGAAVALGVMMSATRLGLPLSLDCWLAVADNRIGPRAYVPQSVLTALNGLRVEVVHTDAEGRLLLADAITLAVRERAPDALIDFATLTGAMVKAVGTRMSGVFSNDAALGRFAVDAGEASGERALLFPLESDYDEELRSDRADLCNTHLEAGGGAIFAARFLSRFVRATPWLHADLSSWRHAGGLGAVGSDVTGWGVHWGAAVLGFIAARSDANSEALPQGVTRTEPAHGH